jgi:prepilin-type N-terminal cleavage/methylation domain-containing protein
MRQILFTILTAEIILGRFLRREGLIINPMRRRAFTLVELLVVIAIIGILSAVAVVSMSSSRDKARIASGQSFEQSIHNAAGDEALAQWDFDDCSGVGIAVSSVTDASGNGNSGMPSGSPQWSSDTPTGRGCSVYINNTPKITSAKAISSLASNSFTVSVWAKRLAANRLDFIFALGAAGQNTEFNMGFRDNNHFICGFWGNDYDSPAAYTDSDWHLWTCVYDAAANRRSMYRDGALVGGDSPYSPFLGSGVLIANPYGFMGNLDDVRLYGKSLTAEAIRKYYAESRARHPVAFAKNR